MPDLTEIDPGSALLSTFILVGFIATAFVFIKLTIIGINYVKVNYLEERGEDKDINKNKDANRGFLKSSNKSRNQ